MRVETVGEIIKKLQKYPQDTPAFIVLEDISFFVEEIKPDKDGNATFTFGFDADIKEDTSGKL